MERAFDDLKKFGRHETLVIVPPGSSVFGHIISEYGSFQEFCITLKPKYDHMSTDAQAIAIKVPALKYCDKHGLKMYGIYEHHPSSGHIHMHGFVWTDHKWKAESFKQWCNRKFGRTVLYPVLEQRTTVGNHTYHSIKDRLEYIHKRLDDNGHCENGMIPLTNAIGILVDEDGKDRSEHTPVLVSKRVNNRTQKLEYVEIPDDDPFFE